MDHGTITGELQHGLRIVDPDTGNATYVDASRLSNEDLEKLFAMVGQTVSLTGCIVRSSTATPRIVYAEEMREGCSE